MDEAKARRRLLNYTLTRFVGVAIFFLGVAIIYTDLLRPGGWPRAGAAIAILGALDAFFAPRLLKKSWERDDRQQQ